MTRNRKVFSSRHIIADRKTGEIISDKVESTYINSSNESFGMYTTTNGLHWAKPLKSYLLFLIVMNEYTDADGVVSLSKHRRKEITEFFNFENERSITTILSFLIKHDVVKRLSKNDFMINPETVYKGALLNKKEKINKYNLL